jgi:DNA invertase Pin-like site-specific DNA recombinase
MAQNGNGPPRLVTYYRVSTRRQGQSGLGLEAQRKAVMDYLNGGLWQVVSEHVEVESGRKVKRGRKVTRPEFERALAACRLHRATLVIAKLDRLARNVHFVSSLMESGIEFVAADNPHASKLTIHILVAMAEHEAEQISARTKDALARSKKKLGGFRGHMPDAKTWAASVKATQAAAAKRAAEVMPAIKALQAAGSTTLQAIANGLNAQNIPTATGVGSWTAAGVARVLKRIS